MSLLTVQELDAIRAQLQIEENLIRQLTAGAHTARDPQRRGLFQQIAARHRLHWEQLETLLQTGEKEG